MQQYPPLPPPGHPLRTIPGKPTDTSTLNRKAAPPYYLPNPGQTPPPYGQPRPQTPPSMVRPRPPPSPVYSMQNQFDTMAISPNVQ
jgi:hypothetical protein